MESVMRHFLHLASSPSVLARGMKSGATLSLLVACPGPMKRFTPPGRGAFCRAIDMAAITTPADANLFGAALTVEQPVVVLEQHAIPLESAGKSRHKGKCSGSPSGNRDTRRSGVSRQRIGPGPSLFLRTGQDNRALRTSPRLMGRNSLERQCERTCPTDLLRHFD